MKAALCRRFDGIDGVEVEDVPEPALKPGDVLVTVTAAALNFFDILILRDKYQLKPELPFSPSGEIAGVVSALGPETSGVGVPDGIAIGTRVAAYIGWGGAREKVAVPADRLVRIPDEVSDETAAGVAITYGTAWHGLKDRGTLKPGETVAILGAAGGAGLAAVDTAKALGARVIAVASSAEKLAVCRAHGADALINYKDTDLKAALRALTDRMGVDVVYDCVGGSLAEPALRAMAWGGRYLVVGFASGEVPKLPSNLLLLKGCAAVGVFWGEFVRRHPDRHRIHMTEILTQTASGKLPARIHATYPLADIKTALSSLENGEAIGKIVLKL